MIFNIMSHLDFVYLDQAIGMETDVGMIIEMIGYINVNIVL